MSHLSNDSGRYANCLCLEQLDRITPAAGRDQLGELGSELPRLRACRRYEDKALRLVRRSSRSERRWNRPRLCQRACRPDGEVGRN